MQKCAAATTMGTGPFKQLTEAAISCLVHRFYTQARHDDLLGPVFATAIGDSQAAWAEHEALVCSFWSSVTLTSGRYHGDPHAAHRGLPGLDAAMFGRWLAVFGATCAELFDRDLATAFQDRAERIARSLGRSLLEREPGRPESQVLPAASGGMSHAAH